MRRRVRRPGLRTLQVPDLRQMMAGMPRGELQVQIDRHQAALRMPQRAHRIARRSASATLRPSVRGPRRAVAATLPPAAASRAVLPSDSGQRPGRQARRRSAPARDGCGCAGWHPSHGARLTNGPSSGTIGGVDARDAHTVKDLAHRTRVIGKLIDELDPSPGTGGGLRREGTDRVSQCVDSHDDRHGTRGGRNASERCSQLYERHSWVRGVTTVCCRSNVTLCEPAALIDARRPG